MWGDPDTAEIETVGIQTGADRGIIVMIGIGVPNTGMFKQGEVLVRQVVKFAAKRQREFRPARPVTGVVMIVLPAAVVKQGEQTDHRNDRAGSRGEDHRVALDAPPVVGTVDGMGRQERGQFQNRFPEGFV